MKNCVNCSAALDDNAALCPVCGASQPTVNSDDQVLHETERYLSYEKKAWKIVGIVFIILSVFLFIAAAAFLTIGLVLASQPAYDYQPMTAIMVFITIGIVYMQMSFTYIPIAVINLVMVNKVSLYQDTLQTDVSTARKRCTSVGMIVFGALFNKIAMIFIIINFARTKSESAAFDRIELKQKGFIS